MGTAAMIANFFIGSPLVTCKNISFWLLPF